MAEYASVGTQTVNPGETVTFSVVKVPCNRGLVRFRQGTGNFLLSGWVPSTNRRTCCCQRVTSADYFATFGANIAVPTGETVGEISLAIAIDGATDATTSMKVTPAAVEEFFNVGRSTNIPIWCGCCETVSIRNTSNIPILVDNPNLVFTRPDLDVTY